MPSITKKRREESFIIEGRMAHARGETLTSAHNTVKPRISKRAWSFWVKGYNARLRERQGVANA